MDSALRQALKALSRSTQGVKLANRKVASKKNATKPQPSNTPAKRDRRKKGSRPIQQLKNGYILYSDGSVRPSPALQKAQIARANVLDQYAWTDKAREQVGRLPLSVFNQNAPAPAGRFTSTYYPSSSEAKRPSGFIGINESTLQADPRHAAEVMTREILPSLDKGVGKGALPEGFPGEGQGLADSQGFYDNLSKAPVNIKADIDKFLLGYEDISNDTRDIESFAQFGADKGQNVLLTSQAPAYSEVFEPMTPNINYLPVFPVKDIYEDMVRALR